MSTFNVNAFNDYWKYIRLNFQLFYFLKGASLVIPLTWRFFVPLPEADPKCSTFTQFHECDHGEISAVSILRIELASFWISHPSLFSFRRASNNRIVFVFIERRSEKRRQNHADRIGCVIQIVANLEAHNTWNKPQRKEKYRMCLRVPMVVLQSYDDRRTQFNPTAIARYTLLLVLLSLWESLKINPLTECPLNGRFAL